MAPNPETPAAEASAIFRPLSTSALYSALGGDNLHQPLAQTHSGDRSAVNAGSEFNFYASEDMRVVPFPPVSPSVEEAKLVSPPTTASPSSGSISRNPNARVRRAHERSRAICDYAFESDPMALAPVSSLRADLGDDDSFSPDIVSGYQFNVPLAREASVTAFVEPEKPPTASADGIEETPIESAAVEEIKYDRHDLGDDDEYRGEDGQLAIADDVAYYHRSVTPERADSATRENDHDHRIDAVYDDLDDIGDWVANSTPAGADLTKRLSRAVNSAPSGGYGKSTVVANAALSSHERAEDRRRENHRGDKLDRATVEQVLDPRTRMILFRLLSRNRLRTLDGCVSTGKEANVYFATAASDPACSQDANGLYPPNPDLQAHDCSPDAAVAVKIFKTSILQFKDRERYVAGEFRFRRGGYQRGSNRKMVQQWAEKEFRNQIRLQEAGIPAPIPLLLKPPILIMSFFGKDGWPAPRLKDATLSSSRYSKIYFRVCMLMRRMFRVAHLVHGDLSEYNMLYWKGDVIIIDVSQSVEDDHPMALDFLRRDCANVNDFFRRTGGVAVLGVRELFDFVTGEHIGDSNEEQEGNLNYLLDSAGCRDAESMRLFRRDDDVFMRSYIPRTLQEVELREQQFRAKPSDGVENSLYAKLTGLTITQKRERGMGGSKTNSVSEGSHTGPTEFEAQRDDHSFSPGYDADRCDQMRAPNLEVALVEPATTRFLPGSEKQRIGTSSPCTSNSSSRPHGEETDPRKFLNRDSSWERPGPSYEAEDFTQQSGTRSLTVRDQEDDTYQAHEDSSSSSDGWIRKSREESSDPYMGLTKKEWKKRVKEEARERREHKVPKHVKKRKEVLAKRRRGHK